MGKFYLTAPQVEGSVREYYAKNGYVCLSQVRNGTGFEKRQVRTADMLAISTWPSRGLFTEGVEIKVSSSDLARELASPAKAEEIAQYCTYWWIAGPEGIADKQALPANWGLISVNEKLKAKVSISAKRLEPKPMDELFVCACLRSFAEFYVPKSDVEEAVRKGTEAACESATRRQQNRLDELEKAVTEFKEHSGIDLMSSHSHVRYDLKDIAKAVQTLANLRHRNEQDLQRIQASLQAGVEVVEVALRAFNGLAEQSAGEQGAAGGEK